MRDHGAPDLLCDPLAIEHAAIDGIDAAIAKLGMVVADIDHDDAVRSYSPRKASMGSVLDARLAGSAEAANASSSIAMAESTSTPGSNGLTSKRKERSKRDAAKAPSKPKPQPTAASLAPELRMNRITPERWQPSAMRTAISCSRNATENAITP
jgi:hypothetical protein